MGTAGRLRRACQRAGVLTLVAALAPAHAHLMVAQKGTLNFSGDGAYMVLSLPVSAFKGADDDGDQLLSLAELRAHAGSIEQQVQVGVQLMENGRPLELQGLMLNPSPPDDAPSAPASQIVVMGLYALGASGEGATHPSLSFKVDLFGRASAEQAYDITFTRKPEAQAARYTPGQNAHSVLPTAGRVFTDYLRTGAEHVLGGMDHLLFLLVVLASLAGARRGWRHAVGALSCFTAGHASTLVVSAWGGVSIAPQLVEPAIAATIIGMAVFDLWQRHRSRWAPPAVQLALVFACALVHGLGLAGALGSLGLSGANLLWSLTGFNLGVELAQVGVAAAAALGSVVLARLAGPASPARLAHAASMLGITAGLWWLMERATPWL